MLEPGTSKVLARERGVRARRKRMRHSSWLAAAVAWEFLVLLGGLPTVSDLADPVLAHPAVRAAVTLAWLIAGAWLVTRPGRRPQSS